MHIIFHLQSLKGEFPASIKKQQFKYIICIEQWTKILWFLESFLKNEFPLAIEFLISKRAQNEINFWSFCLWVHLVLWGFVFVSIHFYLIFHLKWHKIYHLNTWWLNKKIQTYELKCLFVLVLIELIVLRAYTCEVIFTVLKITDELIY